MPTLKVTEAVAGLVERIQSPDETINTVAWQNAGPYGADAVQPLALLMAASDMELARRSERALALIVHHAGHPALDAERSEVEVALIQSLPASPVQVRRTLMWLLSEIGGDRSAEALAVQLKDPEVREDARCALTRLPAAKAVRVLKKRFDDSFGQFKFALAESLRIRGVKIKGYESRKMVPKKLEGQNG